MKRLLCAATVLLVMASQAFAADYDAAYTVGADKSTVAKSEFKLDETPWLYLSFAQSGDTHTASLWSNSLGTGFSLVNEDSGVTSLWLQPSNWATYARTGEWTISNVFTTVTGWTDEDGFKGSITYNAPAINFKVVPEPVSCALFLVGGAALAFSRRRRA